MNQHIHREFTIFSSNFNQISKNPEIMRNVSGSSIIQIQVFIII